MPALLLMLIPLIPGLISSVSQIIDAIRIHPDTPAQVKAQLDAVAAHLDEAARKVAAVELPTPQ